MQIKVNLNGLPVEILLDSTELHATLETIQRFSAQKNGEQLSPKKEKPKIGDSSHFNPPPGTSVTELIERALQDIKHPATVAEILKMMQTYPTYTSTAKSPLDSVKTALYRKSDKFQRQEDGLWWFTEDEEISPLTLRTPRG